MAHPDELKQHVLEARTIDHKSVNELCRQFPTVPRSTLREWTKNHPLSDEQRRLKIANGAAIAARNKHASKPAQSKVYGLTADPLSLTRQHKCIIAESAILFRLSLQRFNVLRPVNEASKTDWLLSREDGQYIKIQVKWMAHNKIGNPTMNVTCSSGHKSRRRYRPGEFDFMIGYDLYSDTAHVFSFNEISAHTTYIAARKDTAERWDKLHEFGRRIHATIANELRPEPKTIMDKILDILTSSSAPMKVKDIHSIVGGSSMTVHKYIQWLYADQKIERVSHGSYRLRNATNSGP